MKDHDPTCPRAQFWDAGEHQAPCTCRQEDCEHEYTYRGIGFSLGHELPGSSARERMYFDIYFCNKCLLQRRLQLDHTDSSYAPPAFGAVPLSNEVSK